MNEPLLKDSHPASGQTSLSLPAEEPSYASSPAAVEMFNPEATRRFRGHEKVVHAVCSLAQEEAQARGLAILKIDVRPAWSHEYDERTGIVIDVEIKASSEERFSYWDTVCELLNELAESVLPEERCFLNDEVSLIVNRS